jgi:hypothetical protein
MENLGRGLIALRDGNGVYLGWRTLGTDPAEVSFDVYRSTNGGQAVRINRSPISNSSNFIDTTVNLGQQNSYYVAPSIDGTPLKYSMPVALPANPPAFSEQANFRIPLQPLPNHSAHFTWVGDLNGDGEYDYVVDRLHNTGSESSKLEAYSSNGDFLWRVDMGPGSLPIPNNFESGPSSISVGHNDGVTVYDMDGDGRSEVVIKSASGVTFGDGQTLQAPGRNRQFVSVLDGMTGAELGRADVPDDYVLDGPVTGHFGIGYLDGEKPSLIYSAQNRIGNGGFNRMALAYDYRNGQMTQRWKWTPSPGDNINKFHQIRVGDVDRDGKDELLDGGFVLDDDGTLLYSIPGITHGDRFHIGDLDPARPGLEGYGIQQNNANGLVEYYYDAATGEMLREHFCCNVDNGRGIAADVDPDHEGYEYWSFFGMYNAQTGEQLSEEPNRPWPNFRIWWDGDVGSENLNETKIDKWDPNSNSYYRIMTGYREGATEEARAAPLFYGDILGDWREEIIFEHWDGSELIILTTTDVTDTRLYTLAHNPLYRNDMTTRGYYQSNMVDYYLGYGMETPPMPDMFVLPLLLGDADGDGVVGPQDRIAVESLLGNTGPAGGSLLGDADGNGIVDATDYFVVSSIIEPQIAAGDYNQDGVVDAADYTVWRDSYGTSGGGLTADGNFDFVVDDMDYAIWRTHFGQTIPAAASGLDSAVPEPTTATLLAVFIGIAIYLRRPRR